jgi:hypothetical protein
MSKGSSQRPAQISDEELKKRWDMAFGNKPKADKDKPKPCQKG